MNNLVALPISKYKSHRSGDWIVLGYGEYDFNPGRRMLKITELEVKFDRVHRDGEVKINLCAAHGMSGGPWINDWDFAKPVATGITSTNMNTLGHPI